MKKIFYSLGLLLLVDTAEAQLYNNGDMYMQAGSSLYIEGAVHNTATAVFANRGQLTINGNIINHAANTAYSGAKLILNGTAAQAISGTVPLEITNLDINNTNGVELMQSMRISGALSFLNGVLKTAGNSLPLIFDGMSAVTSGASANSYVEGWSAVVNKTSFSLPTGANGKLATILLENIQVPATMILVAYGGNNNKTVNGTSYTGGLINISNNWWTFNGAGNTADISLFTSDADDHSNVANIQALRFSTLNNGNWITLPTQVSGTPANGIVKSVGFTTTGTVGIGVHSSLLPVRLLSFTGEKINNKTLLTWKVTGDEDAETYTIERSPDSRTWTSLGTINPRGTTAAVVYNLTDLQPFVPYTSYRLVTRERNGREFISQIVRLRFDHPASYILTPTLVTTGTVNLYNNQQVSAKAVLCNNAGQVIRQINILPGNTAIKVDGLDAGSYHLVIHDNGKLPQVFKFIKQ